MSRSCLAIVMFLLAQPVYAIKVPRGLDTCPSLSICLSILDKVVPAIDDGEGSNGDVLARDLRRFGEPAKQELLMRAAGSHPGWRNVAGAILADWGSWNADDVPALRDALRKDPGGWVARPLGQIGTPDAIRALVEDLSAANDIESQTGYALSKLGASAIPYIFPLLQNDSGARPAAGIIHEIGSAALPFAPGWAGMALDVRQPIPSRIAALRAVAALGPAAKPIGNQLHGLLSDRNLMIRGQAKLTLRTIRDPVLLSEVANACRPTATPFDSIAFDSFSCLSEISDFGNDAQTVGGLVMPFLSSKNGAERSYGITVLGLSGYVPATSAIRDALSADDWRVVYAAVRSLGWIGAKDAIPELDRVTAGHWLPEIREEAAKTAAALRSSKESAEPKTSVGIIPPQNGWGRGKNPLAIELWSLNNPTACPSDLWEWQGKVFSLDKDSMKLIDKAERKGSVLRLRGGELIGTDYGEWGGDLSWHPAKGKPVNINKDNVISILADGEDAIVVFGLSHMGLDDGYVLRLSRKGEGDWKAVEIARLLGEPDAISQLGTGMFAVRNGGRVIVLSSNNGILGLASCK